MTVGWAWLGRGSFERFRPPFAPEDAEGCWTDSLDRKDPQLVGWKRGFGSRPLLPRAQLRHQDRTAIFVGEVHARFGLAPTPRGSSWDLGQGDHATERGGCTVFPGTNRYLPLLA